MPPEQQSVLSTPASTTAATTTTTAAAATTAATSPWHSDEHKGIVETKAWGKPDDVIAGYANLEKLVGGDPKTLVRIPKADDAEGQAKFYNQMGRPETVDKYTPVEALKDDALAKAMAPDAHALGLTDKQWTGLQAKLMERTAELLKGNETKTLEQDNAAQAKRLDALKSSEGDKFVGLEEDARRAMRTAVPDSYKDPATGETLTSDQINKRIEDAIGVDLALRIFGTLGKFQAEDRTVDGMHPASGVMSVAAAQAEWDRLRADQGWFKRYMEGDHEAVRKQRQLAQVLSSARA